MKEAPNTVKGETELNATLTSGQKLPAVCPAYPPAPHIPPP